MTVFFTPHRNDERGIVFLSESSPVLEVAERQASSWEYIKLPVWLYQGSVIRIANLLNRWWKQVETWLMLPIQQLDPDTCTFGMLNLIAAGRGVEPIPNEPEALFRSRVKYAFVNAKDAGNVAGLQRIFERLGIGSVDIFERTPDRDWDVIVLELTDAQISLNQELLRLLIRQYGRTCRRYELNVIDSAELLIDANEFDHRWFYDDAA